MTICNRDYSDDNDDDTMTTKDKAVKILLKKDTIFDNGINDEMDMNDDTELGDDDSESNDDDNFDNVDDDYKDISEDTSDDDDVDN